MGGYACGCGSVAGAKWRGRMPTARARALTAAKETNICPFSVMYSRDPLTQALVMLVMLTPVVIDAVAVLTESEAMVSRATG